MREAPVGENAVLPAHFLVGPVGQKPVLSSKFLGKFFLTRASIDADGENLRIRSLEVSDIILISLEFCSSSTGEGQNIEGQDDILLALELAEANRLAVLVSQLEVGRFVANL